MKKEWHVKVQEEVLGPFTPLELERVPGVTLHSYVWKEGFKKWKKIEDVEELLPFFKKPRKRPKKPNIFLTEEKPGFADEQIVLEGGGPPLFPFFLFALIIFTLFALVIAYYRYTP